MRRQHIKDRIDIGHRRRVAAILPTQNGFGPRFGIAGVEPGADRGMKRQAGQKLGQLPHIGLAIGGIHPQRVQLQKLARQVLVQTGIATHALCRQAARPARRSLIEEFQHQRRLDRAFQQIGKAPGDMRPDRAFHMRGHRPGGYPALAASGEMICPERHQPLAKGIARPAAPGQGGAQPDHLITADAIKQVPSRLERTVSVLFGCCCAQIGPHGVERLHPLKDLRKPGQGKALGRHIRARKPLHHLLRRSRARMRGRQTIAEPKFRKIGIKAQGGIPRIMSLYSIAATKSNFTADRRYARKC